METIWFPGSPANRNIEKAINPTANKTPSAWKARRTMNASINGSHKSCRAVMETAAVVQMIPDADGRVRETDRRRLLLARPIQQNRIIGPLGELHLLGHAPGQRLLVERDVPEILRGFLERFLDQLVALTLVVLDKDLVGQLIMLLIAVIAEIGFAARRLRVIAAAFDIEQDVVAVEGPGSPSEKIERRLVIAGFQNLGEVLRLGLSHQVDLDTHAGEHPDNRLADRLVIHVAIVRAIHSDFEAVRIACFRQQ